MTRRKFQTSWEDTLDSGLYLTSEACPPAWPSNTGSTCTTGTEARVPGLWSFLCPVIQAFRPFSCRLRGRTCSTHSPVHDQAAVWVLDGSPETAASW